MDTIELIDKYIDNQLPQDQARQLEKDFQQDADLKQLLESVRMAREAIRFRALTMRMKGLHEKHLSVLKAEEHSAGGLVVPLNRNRSSLWVYRIAASIMLALLSYSTYQYATLDTADFYNDKFISYHLPNTRSSNAKQPSLNSLYLLGNYTAVINHFSSLKSKEPSDYFLTGVSYLHQKQYQQAVDAFKALRQYNTRHASAYFEQEMDYYLALAYVGDHKPELAYPLFKTIHDTPRHLFSETVTQFDLLKLRTLRLKK